MDQLLKECSEPEEMNAPPPSPPPKKGRGNGWAKLSALLAGAALVVSCVTLVLTLKPELLHPAQEPEESSSTPLVQDETPTLQYRDRQIPVLEGVEVNQYDAACFSVNERGWLNYSIDGQSAAVGVDVSAYQEDVDWQQVAGSGISFAMIRVGYRGYSKGVVMPDKNFEANIQGALDAGLQVGVYFFSQATNVWEAQEEADYVLEAIQDYDITYPVAFDWEFISGSSDARTSGMKAEEVTRCAGAFCDMVAKAGYTPVIYFNQDLGYLTYQLDQLTDYTFWLAEYNARPSFYYHFDLWQYTHKATVPGIEGSVDLNLDFRSVAA